MNYAEQLLEKLRLHSETDLVDIKDDIDVLIDLADKAVDEFDDLEEEKKHLESDVEDLNDTIEEEAVTTTTEWGLLGEQIHDAFDEIMTNPQTNQIIFLQHLEDINNGKIKLP